MKSAFFRRCSLTVLLLFPLHLSAQIDDVGLWLGISVEKQITRRASISLGEQLRFENDISSIDVVLTDVGLDYSISKNFRAGIHYRFMNSNRENYYSKRHRIYVNLSYRYKIRFITLILRERVQQQYNNINSSELGKIPTWVWRSKLTARFDLKKKYTPYIAGEVYYIIDNARERDQIISRIRYETGFDYRFNRVQSVNPFALFQYSPSTKINELIYGIAYSMSF